MKRFGLIGRTLQHSFSGKFFTEKFLKEGRLDHRYDLFELQQIEDLPSLIESHPDLVGLNVTIPYKEKVDPFLNWKQDLVEKSGACNCIHIHHGNLLGYNTDIPAFKACLETHLESHHHRAMILGSGGASKAVAYALQSLSLPYSLVGRNSGNGKIAYEELTREIVEAHPLIIQTTPLGTFPDVDACPPIPYEALTSRHFLFDLVYNPPLTLFLKKGRERGARILNGYEMLVLQAEKSWEIWNQS